MIGLWVACGFRKGIASGFISAFDGAWLWVTHSVGSDTWCLHLMALRKCLQKLELRKQSVAHRAWNERSIIHVQIVLIFVASVSRNRVLINTLAGCAIWSLWLYDLTSRL
jgi:hypothetical protein